MKTKVLSVTDKAISTAAALVAKGEIVAMPTETVYGLAAVAYNAKAVENIFDIKERPLDNPLIAHISNLDMLGHLCDNVPELALTLADFYWPGPLTMVLPKSKYVPDAVTTGLSTVAVRMPSHPAALALIDAVRLPLAAPSANKSGRPSPTKAEHVYADLAGEIPLIIDGGDCEIGVESTVILVEESKITLLRPGAVTPEELSDFAPVHIDEHIIGNAEGVVLSPGMKHKHYAPKCKITLVRGTDKKIEGVRKTHQIYDTPSMEMLFTFLRGLDERGEQSAFVRLPKPVGKDLAIYNRLLRAADFNVIELPVIVGLTGGIGTGKTTASKTFEQAGFFIINADEVAHKVTAPGTACANKILEAFGRVTRTHLAELVFKNEDARAKLNEITHPYITYEIKKIINNCKERFVLIDAPLLFDVPEISELCDVTVNITAPKDMRVERIVKRNGISEQKALARIDAQHDYEWYAQRTDYTVENVKDEKYLFENLKNIIEKVKQV